MRRPSALVFLLSLCVIAASYGGQSYVVPAAGSYSGVVPVTERGSLEGQTITVVNALQREIDYCTRNEFQFRGAVVRAVGRASGHSLDISVTALVAF